MRLYRQWFWLVAESNCLRVCFAWAQEKTGSLLMPIVAALRRTFFLPIIM
jgi:hypothetical protein